MAHVLIADDDSDTREVLSASLREDGHQVIVAADGEEALRLLRTTPHRMVAVLDVSMPKLLGTEVLQQRLQDRQVAWRHGYVLITGLSVTSSQSLPANFLTRLPVPVVILRKPFGEDDLRRTVDQVAGQMGLSRGTPDEAPAH